jgi:dienelactone hydrolase
MKMTKPAATALAAAAFLWTFSVGASEKVERLTFESAGQKRTYYLFMGLLESEYFAAVAVHAGIVSPELQDVFERTPRKIPMAIWVGTDDNFFPLAAVRQTRDALNAHGFNAQLTEIKNHTHDYYGSSADINKQAWAFLRQHTFAADPRFQSYDVRK